MKVFAKKQPVSAAVLTFTILAAAPVVAQNGTVYRPVELTVSGASTKAYALNGTGQVVGWLETDQGKHAAHWHNEVATDLHGTVHLWLQHPPIFNGEYSEAYAISDADQIVGTALKEIDCQDFTTTVANAYLLRPAVLTDIGTPYPGDALTNFGTFGHPCVDLDSAATGISNANHVVGWSDVDGSSAIHAFLVVPVNGQFFRDNDGDLVNDLMIDLGTLPGGSDPVSAASDVNDSGQVTGYSYTINSSGAAAYHAFLLTPLDNDGDGVGDQWFRDDDGDGANDLMVDLGTLGGTNSWGRAINNAGQVVGESDITPVIAGGHFTRATLWEDQTITDLGTLGGDNSAASDINERGDIVGWAENADGQRHAFLYRDGRMYDLNDLLCTVSAEGVTVVTSIVLTEARGINNDGVICGWGAVRGTGGQQTRGFLLIPMDADDCHAEDEGGAGGGSGTTGTGASGGVTGYSGTPIAGTPANLGPGTAPEEANAPGTGGLPSGAGVCGAGAATITPAILMGLWCLKLSVGRRQ